MYEQDWLYTEFTGVNGTLLRSAILGRQWLMQMDRGVHVRHVVLERAVVDGEAVMRITDKSPDRGASGPVTPLAPVELCRWKYFHLFV